jgi:hypothetical protein
VSSLKTAPDDYLFGLLGLDQVIESWGVIRPIIARAFRHGNGEITIDQVLPLVESGRFHVFVMLHDWRITTVFMAEFVNYPNMRAMNIVALAGTKFEALFTRFYEQIKRFASDGGATRITAQCRPAAERMFNKVCGTKTHYRLIAKEI